MRKTFAVVSTALLLAGLLLPGVAAARRETILGSVTINGQADLADKVVGFAVISNPGLEKNIVQHLPPFTLPVFIDTETEDSPSAGPGGGPRVLRRHLDTTLVLTNRTDEELVLEVLFRDRQGQELGTKSVTLPGNGTRSVSLSELLTAPAP